MKKDDTKFISKWTDISGNGNDLVQEIGAFQPIIGKTPRISPYLKALFIIIPIIVIGLVLIYA